MSEDLQELGQISLYLTKPGVAFDAAVDIKALHSKSNFRDHKRTVDGAPCRFIFFESRVPKSNPPWLDFANELLPANRKIKFSAKSVSPNGILGVEVDSRLFVATFGRSSSSAISRQHIETDFGIRAAMNMCGNEQIRQTRTQSYSLTPTHIDRQVTRPSGAFVFGLSEAEDQKSISAQLKGNNFVTLQGRDHLTMKATGAEKLNWEKLIGRCKSFLRAYASEDYVDQFPNYRNFKPASETEIEELDKKLIELLRKKKVDDIHLWIPEFIPNDEFSFTYTDYHKKQNEVFSYLDVGQLASQLNLQNVDIKKLKNKKVYAYSLKEDRVISSKCWSIHRCLVVEFKHKNRNFILADGEWRCVDSDFYDSVVRFIETCVNEQKCEDIYSKISIADKKAKKNREAIFNAEACKRRPKSIPFDMAKLRIGKSRSDKEFCDILDLTDSGEMRIINCKPYQGSAGLSYLFAQTRFYCDSFVKDQSFLEAIRKHVEASTSPTKSLYLEHIKPEVRNVIGADYTVCLWILCDDKAKIPTKSDLPFMAQYELKIMHEHLQQSCKFKEIVLRFIPVETINFVTSTSQAKSKANYSAAI